MDKELARGAIGSVGKYDVSEGGGSIKAAVSVKEGPLVVELAVSLDTTVLLQSLKGHGVLADEIIDAAVAGLQKL